MCVNEAQDLKKINKWKPLNETILIHFAQISLMLLLFWLVPVVTRCVLIEEYTKRNVTVTFFFYLKIYDTFTIVEKKKKI